MELTLFRLFFCIVLGLIPLHPSIANSMIELSKGVYFEQIVIRTSDEVSFLIETQPYRMARSEKVEKIIADFSAKHHLSMVTHELEFPDYLGNQVPFKKFSIAPIYSLYDAKSLSMQLLEMGIQVKEILKCSKCKSDKNQLISVVKIDPNLFRGKVISSLATQSISGLATVSEISESNNSLVSVNGNFFVMHSKLGLPGDISGIAVENGKLLSEAVNNRPALIIDNKGKIKANIVHSTNTKIVLRKGNEELAINGLNRLPNKILNCGNLHNGEFQFPTHDVVCTNNNEIIAFTKEFGPLNLLDEIEAELYILNDTNSSLSKVSGYPKMLKDDETLILATGSTKGKLDAFINSKKGEAVSVSYQVYADGKEISLREGLFIIGGGPTLLLNSQIPLADWYKQGWHISSHKSAIEGQDTTDFESDETLDRSSFYESWVYGEHPRTSVGVDAKGNMYIFAVYGRNPYLSQGMSLTELADFMKSKGVVDAINLDGGGSTAMVVNGRLTGIPSDNRGEREVADALSIILD